MNAHAYRARRNQTAYTQPHPQSVDPRSTTPPHTTLHAPDPQLGELFAFQSALLSANDRLHLRHLTVEKIRALISRDFSIGHVVWVTGGQSPRVQTLSGVDTIDRTTPFMQWLHAHLKSWKRSSQLEAPLRTRLHNNPSTDGFAYPFTHATFIPFKPQSRAAHGGLLITSEHYLPDIHVQPLIRLTEQTALLAAAKAPNPPPRLSWRGRLIFWSCLAAIISIGFIPVPMTALAPAEIIADQPSPISASTPGVIKSITVKPGESVRAGQVIIRLEDTDRRNAVLLAERALQVAKARVRQASLSAFNDENARRTLAVAEAERHLARSKLDYAKDQLSRTRLSARRDGIALFSSVEAWDGASVQAGQTIMRVADPSQIKLRIDAPLAHGEALSEGAQVRFFPDSNPVDAAQAKVEQVDFEPTVTPDGKPTYRAEAVFDTIDGARIGARGVAKIYGERAPLGYWLIRRPLTILRQWTGF